MNPVALVPEKRKNKGETKKRQENGHRQQGMVSSGSPGPPYRSAQRSHRFRGRGRLDAPHLGGAPRLRGDGAAVGAPGGLV